jgi:hypothetical protein
LIDNRRPDVGIYQAVGPSPGQITNSISRKLLDTQKMKAIYLSFTVALVLSFNVAAQSDLPSRERPRVVTSDTLPKANPPVVQNSASTLAKKVDEGEFRDVKTGRTLTFRDIKSKIAEAKRELQTKPLSTAAVTTTEGGTAEYVRIAFQDWKKGSIDFVVLTKDQFLSVADEEVILSEAGRSIRVRTIRGNGVNTPIALTDDNGDPQQALMVQYPVIRNGKFIEMAYYMSTHPGLVTQEVVAAGRIYVRNVVDLAREKLRENGIIIQPKIADMAERLAGVEHVDHIRFRTEPQKDIFDDIYTLYALNEGQTYRYSVSSAGAGGMVQMIPSTYRMVRGWVPQANLHPDFVIGMQNHVNATQAMLVYMQRTWNDLVASQTINDALASGIATPEQLMAAGYNSNPARLAGYINRGGTGWTNLIPRETQIYLNIYESIDRNVPMAPRTK